VTLRTSPAEIVRRSSNPLLGTHETWERVRLGDVAEVLNGFAFKSAGFTKGPGLPLIRIRDVGRKSSETNFSGPYEQEYVVHPGSILVGMDGDFRAARWSGPTALLNQRVCKITVRDHSLYNEHFLLYALPGYLDAIHSHTSAVTVKHLSSVSVQDIPLPLPPRAEQDRIVAAIEKLFSHLDAGIESLERARPNLVWMRAAVLQAAIQGRLVPHDDFERVSEEALAKCADEERRQQWKQRADTRVYKEPTSPAKHVLPLAVPSHWVIPSLEAITDPVRTIRYGILMPKEDVEGGVPYVRVKDMQNGRIDLKGLRRTSTEIDAKYRNARLRPGDLLLAIRGTYGRVAEVPQELDRGNITQDTARIAPLAVVMPSYLKLYLSSPHARHYYDRVARGVAVKGINIADLRAMPVPLPPLAEQQRIVREVEQAETLIKHAEGIVESSLRRSATLRRSVLAQAFAGRLVPQDPDAEPVSALLERIAASTTNALSRRRRGRAPAGAE
jgi:type I restriction enzyme, S subunit